MNRQLLISALLLSGMTACGQSPGNVDAPVRVSELADEYYSWLLQRSPEEAYFAGVELERHDGMFDNSPEAQLDAQQFEDALYEKVRAIDMDALAGSPDWITLAYLQQQLASSIGLRVCRSELWGVNQMGGWHLAYSQVAQLQPAGTAELRQQALDRWSKFPAFVDQEIANLETGLSLGFSSPRAVVARVVEQVDGLLALPATESPFFSVTTRDTHAEFAEDMLELVEQRINPALRRYRDFLVDVYLDAARSELSVTANPDGSACYEASLRAYTTVDRSGRNVFELGRSVVDANAETVIELGRAAYGFEEFSEIIESVKSDPADRFASRED
ncbi:MAG: DUF885 family protein, partial [Woeseiaceae bacterium]